MSDLVGAFRVGLPAKYAGPACGISAALFFDWQARGRAGEQPFAELLERIKVAKAQRIRALRQCIMDEVEKEKGWNAAAWDLQRVAPEYYGNRVLNGAHNPDEEEDSIPREERLEAIMNEAIGRGDLERSKQALELLQALNPEKWLKAKAQTTAEPAVLEVPIPSLEL